MAERKMMTGSLGNAAAEVVVHEPSEPEPNSVDILNRKYREEYERSLAPKIQPEPEPAVDEEEEEELDLEDVEG
jgi:hypothetical protein